MGTELLQVKDDNIILEQDYGQDEYDSISDTDDQHYDNFHQYSGALNFLPIKHSSPMLFLLGRSYHPINDYTHIREDESKHLIWLTYRSDFEEIAPYAIKSDAG